ncbi:heat shock transcription factor (hsf) [Anopheles sinensis]|uniref:Heat shock transcription factor (Hsf) n=1 Tax=Anopheles sinensis TaxID=74873 RepID=A0A084WLV0_ANOSI|nr:heat shock transcription factor (hsf) [Anopheles sinensis]
MHTFSETGTGVPAFLAKLWRLVEDAETNDLISWSTDGRSFIIQNQAQFAKELLPLNYKHNNMASFIRQLNMYGFHKITSIDNGGLRFDRDEMEFTHPCFQKDHPYLLEHIKRKIATSKQQQLQAQQAADDKSALKLEAVSRVLSEVKNMRGRQDSLDSRFQAMKQENEALWREVAILRQKHHKQQQIVNKLIQFLVTIVQPSRGGLGSMGNGNNKRRFQLMINDAPQQAKLKKSDYSDGGATIEELGEALEEVAYANQQELLSKQDKSDKKEIPVVTAQIVLTPPSTSASATSTSASGTVVGKGSKATSSNTATLGGGRAIIKILDGGTSIIKKRKMPPGGKSTRNSEIPEVSSPMSFTERSPYHRTATPAMSTGGSSIRSSNNSAPTNLAQLIENAVDEDELESYGDIVEQEIDEQQDGGSNEADEEDDPDALQHGYLVDHVDEIDPTIVQLYQDGDNDMMLNTPMVIREMEKQQQQKQQTKERQQRLQQLGGKRGDSLLKTTSVGGGSLSGNKRNVGSQRNQKSLLNTPVVSPGKTEVSGLKSSSTSGPMIVTRGGKKLALANAAKKQAANATTGGEDDASPGPSGYQSGGSTHSPSPPVSIASASGPTFLAEGPNSGTSSYVTASDILPGDIFEISNDQNTLEGESGGDGGNGVMVKDTNPVHFIFALPFELLGELVWRTLAYSTTRLKKRPRVEGYLAILIEGGCVPVSLLSFLPFNVFISFLFFFNCRAEKHTQHNTQLFRASPSVRSSSSSSSSSLHARHEINFLYRAEYGQHIDTVQTDLESLKELLKGEGYQLDANALLGNACSTVPTYGRVYFPSGPFDPDTINKVRTDVSINDSL